MAPTASPIDASSQPPVVTRVDSCAPHHTPVASTTAPMSATAIHSSPPKGLVCRSAATGQTASAHSASRASARWRRRRKQSPVASNRVSSSTG